MCGILGIYGHHEVFPELVLGIRAAQHRGQDATGIVTYHKNKTFRLKKGLGQPHEVFYSEADYARFRGNIGIAHTRYTTQGRLDHEEAQPFTVHYPFGLAMAHNGNITNFEELKESLITEYHHMIESSNDAELLLHKFAIMLRNKNLKNITVKDIFQSVEEIQSRVQGAYAAVGIIANYGMLAFLDPDGIRPLILGRKEDTDGPSFAFASETRCFDYLGYEPIHDLQPGEAIFIDHDRRVHSYIGVQKKRSFCVFEYIYFSKEDSMIHGRSMAAEREKMGAFLAKKFVERQLAPDVVIDVPSSSYFYAQGLADALNIPYKKGFVKNNNTKRSFILPTQHLREEVVKQKLNPIRSVIAGKKVAVVDDSIVRGTTSKRIVQLLKKAGAKEIYFASGSPPVRHPCVYGIDMSKKSEMIAANKTIDEICQFIGADQLIYPTVEELRNLYEDFGICDACFSGEYPTDISQDIFTAIERDKILSCR